MACAQSPLPSVTLDRTLAELYRLANPQYHAGQDEKKLGLVYGMAHSGIDLNRNVHRSRKFMVHDGYFVRAQRPKLRKQRTPEGQQGVNDDDDEEQMRRSLAVKFMSIIPQRDAFISGDSTVVLFDVHPDENEDQEEEDGTCTTPSSSSSSSTLRDHDRAEVDATLSSLRGHQRPRVVYCTGPAAIDMDVPGGGIDVIAGYKFAVDGLEGRGYPLAVGPETHWFLNSKAALARSGLPTPQTEVLGVCGRAPVTARECCDACCKAEVDREGDNTMMAMMIPEGCAGPRGEWMRQQEGRIVAAVARREVPFVFKTQQTVGGGGTWIVGTQGEKEDLVGYLSGPDSIIRRVLAQIDSGNEHLEPGNMMISEMVRDVVGNYGATFFVTTKGEVIFMGVSEQMMAGDGKAWVGSVIDYADQDWLRQKLQDVMDRTARWLGGRHGYCGPVGLDVLEGVAGPGTTAEMLAVDLNVRVTGSMSLPLLKGHFFTERGLRCAGMITITTGEDRAGFIQRWEGDFRSGRMIIISWHRDPQACSSTGCVVVGAEDHAKLAAVIQRVREQTEEVTF